MANKVIVFSDYPKTLDNREVYKDINMDSDRNLSISANDVDEYLRFRISKNVNTEAVRRSMINLFTWTQGERILDPLFGNPLKKYLYEGIMSYNVDAVIAELNNMILKYEPRVSLISIKKIENLENTENNTVEIEIKFKIIGIPEVQILRQEIRA